MDPAAANIVGITFVDIASTRMANIQTVMDVVLAAENNVLTPILKALFIIYIGRQFLLTMSGDLTIRRFLDTILRAGIIILLVTHNGAFVQYVREPVFNKIPQELSAMVGGRYAATTANQPLAAQFDQIAAKSDAISAAINKESTSVWSIDDWINSATAGVSNLCFQIILACIVGIWLLGQTILAIILTMGMPLLCFEIFERTRGFVDQWIGKLVGFAAFGFATSFVLALEIQEMVTRLDKIHAGVNDNVAAAVGMLVHAVGDAFLDLLTVAFIPSAVGFGSGAAAALAAPSLFMAMRALSLVTGPVGAAASNASRALSRLSGTARAANAVNRRP